MKSFTKLEKRQKRFHTAPVQKKKLLASFWQHVFTYSLLLYATYIYLHTFRSVIEGASN